MNIALLSSNGSFCAYAASLIPRFGFEFIDHNDHLRRESDELNSRHPENQTAC